MTRSSAAFGSTPTSATTIPIDYDEPQIQAVSYSRMRVGEECMYQALLKFARKIPEPVSLTGAESPLDRGSRVHQDAENYVLGKGKITKELESVHTELHDLHERFLTEPNTIELEQMWCFTTDWGITAWNDWDNIWCRVKQDAVITPDADTVIAIDYKTGKKHGNEVKHNDQLRIGLLGASFKYPEATRFIAENWYTDQDMIIPQEYSRPQVMGMYEELDGRLRAITTATSYPASPSERNCRFCPYKTGRIDKHREGTGDCPYAHIG